MARSKRKTPIFGYSTATTEKQDKRLANRAFRRAVKLSIKAETEVMPALREVSNIAVFRKDGKRYAKPLKWGKDALKKAMRK